MKYIVILVLLSIRVASAQDSNPTNIDSGLVALQPGIISDQNARQVDIKEFKNGDWKGDYVKLFRGASENEQKNPLEPQNLILKIYRHDTVITGRVWFEWLGAATALVTEGSFTGKIDSSGTISFIADVGYGNLEFHGAWIPFSSPQYILGYVRDNYHLTHNSGTWIVRSSR